MIDVSIIQDGEERIQASRICSVRYDLWEEKLKLKQRDQTLLDQSLDFQDYSRECLQLKIHPSLATKGVRYFATAQFTQLSGDSSVRIRDWLIQQQSSILRGLFSHMLGDLRVAEQSKAAFEIPPKPKIKPLDKQRSRPRKDLKP